MYHITISFFLYARLFCLPADLAWFFVCEVSVLFYSHFFRIPYTACESAPLSLSFFFSVGVRFGFFCVFFLVVGETQPTCFGKQKLFFGPGVDPTYPQPSFSSPRKQNFLFFFPPR